MGPQQPREEADEAPDDEQPRPHENDSWDPISRHELTIRTLSRRPHTLSGMVVTLVRVCGQSGWAISPPPSPTRTASGRG